MARGPNGRRSCHQNYGVETLNRDRQPLEKKGDVSFILDLRGDHTTQLSEEIIIIIMSMAVEVCT